MTEESLDDQGTPTTGESTTSSDEAAGKEPVGEKPNAGAVPDKGATTGAGSGGRGVLVTAGAAVVALIVGAGAGWAVGDRSSSGDDSSGADEAEAAGHEGHGGRAEEDGEDDGLAELLSDHHYHEPTDEAVDSETRQLLTVQMDSLNDVFLDKYPTVGDAADDGWRRAGPFIPGLGTHYISGEATEYTVEIPDSVDGDGGEEVRPLLIYEGLEEDAPLAGYMLMALGDEEPEGFAGPYDTWHRHTNICVVQTDGAIELPFVGDQDNVTEEMCTDRGGRVTEISAHMLHVWSVPGYDSELGTFSEVNPLITCPDGGYHRHPYDQLESDETTCVL